MAHAYVPSERGTCALCGLTGPKHAALQESERRAAFERAKQDCRWADAEQLRVDLERTGSR